jgi:hypothetical protein
LLPNLQRVIVGRFRSRADADGHLQFLRQHIPNGHFVVMFDLPEDPAASELIDRNPKPAILQSERQPQK